MTSLRESPRIRRLRTDHAALEQLQRDSSIFAFEARDVVPHLPPERYLVRFLGKGIWRPAGMERAFIREQHEVEIRLGAAYPRNMPELRWRTPMFHPNISSSGSVCLGGYGKHWVPGLRLDGLCHMLWDMLRWDNFDLASPFNRDAAAWAQIQREYTFPVDPRPIRNRVTGPSPEPRLPPIVTLPKSAVTRPRLDDIVFLDAAQATAAERRPTAPRDVLYIE